MNPNPLTNQNDPMQDEAQQKTSGKDLNLIQAEIEHNIPVKQHNLPAAPNGEPSHNPITHIKQFLEADKEKPEHQGLEHVLKDINRNVKAEDKNSGSKPKSSFFRKKIKPENSSPVKSKPILVIAVAAAVACALMAATFYAFKHDTPVARIKASTDSLASKKVDSNAASKDTSQQTSAVSPGDLSSLSLSLQSKINAFNDEQDFNQQDLSDQSLGL
jgi:hypothetical protein